MSKLQLVPPSISSLLPSITQSRRGAREWINKSEGNGIEISSLLDMKQCTHKQRGQIDVARFFLCCCVGEVIIPMKGSVQAHDDQMLKCPLILRVQMDDKNSLELEEGPNTLLLWETQRECFSYPRDAFNCCYTFAILPRSFSTWFVLLLYYYYYSSYWLFFFYTAASKQHGR